MSRVFLFDIPFDPLYRNEIPSKIILLMESKKQSMIFTPNPEMILLSLEDSQMKNILQKSSLSLADGAGILWAFTFLHLPEKGRVKTFLQFFYTLACMIFFPSACKKIIPERITGVDTMSQLCHLSQEKKYKVFLLGAGMKVNTKLKKQLEHMYPGILIVGNYSGHPFTADDEVILKKINDTQPDILFVAFGSPKQEKWIHTYISQFPSVKIAMGIGGAFDFLAGEIKRAPLIFQKLQVEWFWRLFQEPRKRLPRIWKAVFVFPWKVLKFKLSS